MCVNGFILLVMYVVCAVSVHGHDFGRGVVINHH